MKKAVFFFLSFFFLSALPAFASCTATLNPPNIPANTSTTVNVTYTDSSYAVGSVGENASMNSVAGITTPSWSTGCTVYNSDHYGCAMGTAHQNDGSWTVPVTFNISSDQIGHFEVDPAAGGSSDFCNAILYVNSDYPTQTPTSCTVSLNPPHIPANTTTTVNVTYTDSSYAVGSVGENASMNSVAGITTPSWSTGCTVYNSDHYGCAMGTAHQNDGSWTVPVDFNISSDQTGRFEVDPAAGGSLPTHLCYATVYLDSDYPNQPPSINALSNATINEGDTYSANGSFTDSDSTSWTATVDYGDGTGSQPLTLSGTNFSLSHVYKDNGTYIETVSVTDNQGATGSIIATVTVNNVTPTVGAITAPSSPVLINTAITASANFTDPGVLDTHTASWNWGDGNTTTGTVTESNGSGSVSNNHTYTATGVYTITLTVTDKDGGVGQAPPYQYVAVYDSTSSFAGGRSFDNPSTASPSTTGKVSFGISAKYNNSNVLTGSVKMNFKAASIDFASISLSSLATSNGKAYLKGSGTVNGSGSYTFLASGIDGSVAGGNDLIRFQIKDASNNVIYDSQPGAGDTTDPTTIDATGNIRVH